MLGKLGALCQPRRAAVYSKQMFFCMEIELIKRAKGCGDVFFFFFPRLVGVLPGGRTERNALAGNSAAQCMFYELSGEASGALILLVPAAFSLPLPVSFLSPPRLLALRQCNDLKWCLQCCLLGKCAQTGNSEPWVYFVPPFLFFYLSFVSSLAYSLCFGRLLLTDITRHKSVTRLI